MENGEPVNEKAAGVSYSRTTTLSGGRFVMVATSHALASAFPASETSSAAATLRRISEYPVSLRYTPPDTALAEGPSTDDAKLSPALRGEAAFNRKDYAAAEKAFSVALATGTSAKLYYDRAAARAARGKDEAAEADLRSALKLDPTHALSHYALGRIELARGNMASAAEQFAGAVQASGGAARIVWPVAVAYQNSEHFAEAIPYYDKLLQITPPPSAREVLLNQRCWTRAEWGHELDQALQDCDEALRIAPNQPDYLDSRGLIELRMHEYRKAIADYSHALASRPKLATSLYGRGLAEMRLGDTIPAHADISQAIRLNPSVEKSFARWGVTSSDAAVIGSVRRSGD